MRPQERRRCAVEAAVAVADHCGLAADRPRILSDANNTLVHLATHPIVAKVGTSAFRDAELESLQREVEVAAFLAARGAPVIAPHVAPGPHRWEELTVTLWQYAEPVPGAALDAAGALGAVHAALAAFLGDLPPFALELDDARRLLEPDRSPALAARDRRAASSTSSETRCPTRARRHGPFTAARTKATGSGPRRAGGCLTSRPPAADHSNGI